MSVAPAGVGFRLRRSVVRCWDAKQAGAVCCHGVQTLDWVDDDRGRW